MADLVELPLWLQGGTYNAENDRVLLRALVDSQGIHKSTNLKVSQKSTPNMSVDVSKGRAFISRTAGTPDFYVADSTGTVNLTIGASDPTNARIDLVVMRVYDAAYSGSTNKATLEIVPGTPAATPVAPTVPDNSLELAEVLVSAGVTSILDAKITDKRVRAQFGLRRMTADDPADVGLVVKLAPAATGDGFQIVKSDGTVLAHIDKDGNLVSKNLPADTGWVTVTTGASTGFNLTDPLAECSYRIVNGFIEWHIRVYRSSATTITGGSSGNIADLPVFTMPAGTRPGRVMDAVPVSAGFTFGLAKIDTSGLITVTNLHSSGTLSQGDTARFTIPPYVPET